MIDELRTGNAIALGDITLIPIEHYYFQPETRELGGWLLGLKEPYAIVIKDRTGVRALDTSSVEISLESLIRDIPELEAILTS